MPLIRNISPVGDLDIPLIRATVAAGATVEVSSVNAAVLLAQADNFAPADAAAEVLLAELTTEPPAPPEEPAAPAQSPPAVVDAGESPDPIGEPA